MTSIRQFLGRFGDRRPDVAAVPAVPAPVAAATPVEAAASDKALRALLRQVGELRGLLHQQSDLTLEALRRAGWQSDDEAAQQAAVQRVLRLGRGRGDIIVGPWTGEVGFELMYWIPFLNWLVEQGLDANRLVIVSRGGSAPWYRHLTTRYVDALSVMTPDAFREGTSGPKKQVDPRRELDRSLVARVREKLGLADDTEVVHPFVMYRLFAGLWRRRASIDLVESFTSYRPLLPPAAEPFPNLPAGYVLAKFYFSKAFPDTGHNRTFVRTLLDEVSRRMPVVLLSTATRLDEHSDFQTPGQSGLFVVDAHTVPERNLECQTSLLGGARGFIGTYGGFSYLAPFYGVRSLSFFSRRSAFETHHLDLANRVFDRLLPGGFLALDRRAADLVTPAVERWRAVAPVEQVTT